jgi:hypothetical protein
MNRRVPHFQLCSAQTFFGFILKVHFCTGQNTGEAQFDTQFSAFPPGASKYDAPTLDFSQNLQVRPPSFDCKTSY